MLYFLSLIVDPGMEEKLALVLVITLSGALSRRTIWPALREKAKIHQSSQKPNSKTYIMTLRIFALQMRHYPKSLSAVVMLLPVLVALQGGAIPMLYSRAIDTLNTPGASIESLKGLLLAFIGLHLLVFSGQRLFNIAASNLEFRVIRDLEQKIFSWLIQQSHTFHTEKFGGALVAQAKRFTGAYSNLYTTLFFDLATLSLRFAVAIGFLIFLAPPIAALLATWTMLYVTIIVYLTNKKIHMTQAAAQADSLITAQLSDTISNAMVVQMFGREGEERTRYQEISEEKYGKRKRDWRYSEAIVATQSLLMVALEACVLYISFLLVQNGSFSIGQLALVQFFLGPILLSLWNIGRMVRQIESGLADAEEMTLILTNFPSVQDIDSPRKLRVVKGNICFTDINFSYTTISGKQRQIFKNFSLDLEPGKVVGLVGHSGSGKSTLTKLLLRFMDVQTGSIRIDGQDISQVAQSELRKQIAFVPQEPLLFHRSIKENIRYGNPTATDAQVIAAAKKAQAHAFIEALPEDYDTMVGERGGKLSGGERQRIAIARAIIKDAPIVILDEATSALDTGSEKMIQRALNELMKNRTAIIIAHRLSTVKDADRIVVLDHGTKAQDGPHKQLIGQKGLYASLWEHQSGSQQTESD